MVDKTCPLCSKRQVGVRDIIAGGKGQVYQVSQLNLASSVKTVLLNLAVNWLLLCSGHCDTAY
jgi:hypothetical protein